ncbi:MAG: ROK family transcriptional regulator [Lachnospiraceae bacterium]|nr:ROK family transcriptional regulator [Lachnospiraceae bacterium]
MAQQKGINYQDVKQKNKLLVLKCIATSNGISRVAIADATGLSKMTVGNIVTELMEEMYVSEEGNSASNSAVGRRPVQLTLSSASPVVCGILIKRYVCQIILSDLSGIVIDTESFVIHQCSGDKLITDMLSSFKKIQARSQRPICYIGISSLGPINAAEGKILRPPFFYNISDLPLVSRFEQETGLPTALIHDANAGALAELLYGLGKNIHNYVYLHIWNGIGAGIVINGNIYGGDSGQSGEIGHTSINYSGPLCDCGNHGCLDLYASIENMQRDIIELSTIYSSSPLVRINSPSWEQIVSAASTGDSLGLVVLDRFCSYISFALVNTLNLLNISTIIVGYPNPMNVPIVEKLMQPKLQHSLQVSVGGEIRILHSSFRDAAPLIGSVAVIADRVFSGELPLPDYHRSPSSSLS